jgi:acyl dehydratase
MSDELDTTDIERYIGVPLLRNHSAEPVQTNDIRRWAQAMRHPNPLYYDAEYAANSRFGQIVAPQSFTVNTEGGHGSRPALQGNIPDSHMLFAGDEWWFHGPRIVPGDRVTVDHMAFDFRRTTTKFAGPTVIQRGDNHYANQRGENIALQRSSAVRYKPKNLLGSDAFAGREEEPSWTAEMLEKLDREKYDYVKTVQGLGHDPRPFESVSAGYELPTRVIGPHNVVTFTTEWRAYTMNIWQAMSQEHLIPVVEQGFTEEMSVSTEKALWDPEFGEDAYYGASRGHLFPEYAKKIGMPRPYGYGASIGAWILDYLSTWAGEWGFVSHTNSQYRGPAFTGDVTYMRGAVTKVADAMKPGFGQAHVDYILTNQRDDVLAKGSGEVLLPRS